MKERTAKIIGEVIGIIIPILLVSSFVGFVIFVAFNSCGFLSNEETKIVTITDKWTDYNKGFYIIDSNNTIYKLFDSKGIQENSYRYEQIVTDNEYKLTIKTTYLFEKILLLNEEKIV